jgi:hypothetical protein
MLRHLFALSLFAGISLLTGPVLGQTGPAQAPIVCGVKDYVEDADCRNKLKGLFTRKGDTLTLRLDDGKTKTYVGNHAACEGENADAEKCLVFNVLRYFRKPNRTWSNGDFTSAAPTCSSIDTPAAR